MIQLLNAFTENVVSIVMCISLMMMMTDAITASDSFPTVHLPSCNVSLVGWWRNVSTHTQQPQSVATIAEFLGIPFAWPPTGQRRLSHSHLLECPATSTTFDATFFGSPCLQSSGGLTLGAEDCLFLNIYVPSSLLGSQGGRAPVVVYLHAGSLTTGTGAFEDLAFLAAFAAGDDHNSHRGINNSAVVVTINYRLGVLGFLATRSMCETDPSSCGNFGISDQITALKWVQRHISSFGGDPRRVNLVGQSSGGTAVFALAASPLTSGLFSSGLALSGSPNISMTRTVKFLQDEPIPSSLGCSEGAMQLACLRALPALSLLNARPGSWSTSAIFSNRNLNNNSQTGKDFPGLVYIDGVILLEPVWDAVIESGVNSNVSLMFGSMGQECNLESANPSVEGLSQEEWRAFIAEQILETWPNASSKADSVYRLYQNASMINPQLASDSFNADYGMSCAFHHIAKRFLNSAVQRVSPAYVFVHQQGPQKPPFGENHFLSYAFHAWDYVNACHNWNDYLLTFVPGEEDLELSRLQRSQWYDLWSTGVVANWPSIGSRDKGKSDAVMQDEQTNNVVPYFLYAQVDRYPFLATGATTTPVGGALLCPYIRDELGMDNRYWWCD